MRKITEEIKKEAAKIMAVIFEIEKTIEEKFNSMEAVERISYDLALPIKIWSPEKNSFRRKRPFVKMYDGWKVFSEVKTNGSNLRVDRPVKIIIGLYYQDYTILKNKDDVQDLLEGEGVEKWRIVAKCIRLALAKMARIVLKEFERITSRTFAYGEVVATVCEEEKREAIRSKLAASEETIEKFKVEVATLKEKIEKIASEVKEAREDKKRKEKK